MQLQLLCTPTMQKNSSLQVNSPALQAVQMMRLPSNAGAHPLPLFCSQAYHNYSLTAQCCRPDAKVCRKRKAACCAGNVPPGPTISQRPAQMGSLDPVQRSSPSTPADDASRPQKFPSVSTQPSADQAHHSQGFASAAAQPSSMQDLDVEQHEHPEQGACQKQAGRPKIVLGAVRGRSKARGNRGRARGPARPHF